MITYPRRGPGDPERGISGMDQEFYVVDPWGITGYPTSCLNPMDCLDPNDIDFNENAAMLAEAVIKPREGASPDPFWDDSGLGILSGIIGYVASDESEAGNRNLGRVRDILVSDEESFKATLARMYLDPNPVIRSTATRVAAMEPRLRV